ncbi:cyanophycinase [Longitalea arenae]|uniref:cyanophycinase n=1 Tax=Longitalea arenae TaxID=2812558 RepID=UPI0019681BCD|nr:cyanophycinase [Longitalea arenae]
MTFASRSAMTDQITEKKQQQECPVPKGILVIIGGKENKGEQPDTEGQPENVIPLEVLKSFASYIRKKNPVVEVITTSSSEGEESFKQYQKLFKELNISQVRHIHHNSRKDALTDGLAERVQEADAFFFTGGDQLKITTVYGGTPFLTAMKLRYINDPLVIAGSSAGAMALSTPMIYAGNKDVEQISGEIKITTGLEFLKDVCIDTHFVHRGRFVRMAQVIVTNPTSIGIGIEEDTAIIIRNGVEMEVIGSGTVIIIDGSEITESNITEFSDRKAVAIRDLKVHMLGRKDTYKIPQVNPPHK